jgi:hypothetical protein
MYGLHILIPLFFIVNGSKILLIASKRRHLLQEPKIQMADMNIMLFLNKITNLGKI